MALLSNPVAFTCGAVAVRWYGLLCAAGFLASAAHWARRARRDGRPAGFGVDYAVVVTVSGLVGARLAYVLAHLERYVENPGHLLRLDRGGLIFLGGFLLASLVVVPWGRRRGMGPAALLDFGVTGLPLAHAFGRIGCFLNGCCHGAPAVFPWGWPGPAGFRVPVQLYEAGFNLLLYVLLNRVHGRHRPGATFGLYLLLYGGWRFAAEFVRGDPRLIWGPLHAAQWVCLGLVAAGAWLWMRLRTKDPS